MTQCTMLPSWKELKGTDVNKHKFVRKVAKKNLLLISFKFSASIKWGFARLTGQRGPNRVKHLSNRVKQCQTRLNRLRWNLKGINYDKMGLNWVKWELN